MITELRQPLHMQTPKGAGWAHFVVDYGTEHDLIWIVVMDADGACWSVPNPEIRLSWNWTAGRRPPAADQPKAAAVGAAPPRRRRWWRR